MTIMAFMEWNESFSVNIESIDQQHKKLIEMIDTFYDHMKNDKKQAFGELLNGMAEYAVFHFQYEEKYFKQFNYPGTEEHVKEHNKFIEKVSDVKSRFEAGKPVVTPELTVFLRNWLVSHIQGSDKKYSECFIKNDLK